jgi:hypothetical protein
LATQVFELTGDAAAGTVGSVGRSVSIALSGVSARGSAGSVTAIYWKLIDDLQTANWALVDSAETAGWTVISNDVSAGWQLIDDTVI